MFETPMIWREPQNHRDDCYFCVAKINGINPGNRNKWSYPNLSFAQRPQLKSREVHPSTSKSFNDPNPCDPERNTSSENSDSDYKFSQELEPFNQKELSDIVMETIKSQDHKWFICVDLKTVNFLLGRQGGYTKFPCFMCLWDSRDKQHHWSKKSGHCQVIYSQFGLAIHQNDHQARRRFVEWAQNEIAVVPDFHKRILFSDEAHFWLNGYVNKQNCRIWSETNPQVYVETPLHPEKLTVWCALWAGGIIGPYFYKNDEGHNVTVNGDRYRAMITNFFIPELNNHVVQELWFQQDGATCHTARATIDLLKDAFGDRLISRFGPVNWPPRSYDLTPLDYFLWGYVKSLVYTDKPQTLDHLEDNIRRVIADIRPQMLENVIENWTSRLDYIRTIHGSHMPEIIFKM
ncbi:putative transposable element [Trichonephila clavipes]|nr:putative transposable element [Trichonephila clavipes]